jgi:hypothetical protein
MPTKSHGETTRDRRSGYQNEEARQELPCHVYDPEAQDPFDTTPIRSEDNKKPQASFLDTYGIYKDVR